MLDSNFMVDDSQQPISQTPQAPVDTGIQSPPPAEAQVSNPPLSPPSPLSSTIVDEANRPVSTNQAESIQEPSAPVSSEANRPDSPNPAAIEPPVAIPPETSDADKSALSDSTLNRPVSTISADQPQPEQALVETPASSETNRPNTPNMAESIEQPSVASNSQEPDSTISAQSDVPSDLQPPVAVEPSPEATPSASPILEPSAQSLEPNRPISTISADSSQPISEAGASPSDTSDSLRPDSTNRADSPAPAEPSIQPEASPSASIQSADSADSSPAPSQAPVSSPQELTHPAEPEINRPISTISADSKQQAEPSVPATLPSADAVGSIEPDSTVPVEPTPSASSESSPSIAPSTPPPVSFGDLLSRPSDDGQSTSAEPAASAPSSPVAVQPSETTPATEPSSPPTAASSTPSQETPAPSAQNDTAQSESKPHLTFGDLLAGKTIEPPAQPSTSIPDDLFTISRTNDPFATSSKEPSASQTGQPEPQAAPPTSQPSVAVPQPSETPQPTGKSVSFRDLLSGNTPVAQSPSPQAASHPQFSGSDEPSDNAQPSVVPQQDPQSATPPASPTDQTTQQSGSSASSPTEPIPSALPAQSTQPMTSSSANAPSQASDDVLKEVIEKRRQHATKVRQAKREDNLVRIRKLIEEKREITNFDVRDLLHIGQSTATTYLSELVKHGMVKMEKKGRATVYRA